MLSFFRRIINSRIGVIITLVLLVVIALAFAAGDITGLRSNGNGATGATLAKVGDQKLTDSDLRDRVQFALKSARQQQPSLNMPQFLALGGFEDVTRERIDTMVLETFGNRSGMVVSKRLVDGEIASIPAFQGFNGKFDQKLYESLLRRQQITDQALRTDIRTDKFRQWLLGPTQGAAQVPEQLALPYASLLLERRQGSVAFLPAASLAPSAAPNDQQLTAFYAAHRARYTVPERRVVRYAMVAPDTVKAQVTPSDAEIATAYQSNAQRFAATEKRTLRQVVAADLSTANAIAAKVKAGTTIDQAASAIGLAAAALPNVTQADYARSSTPDVAKAVFAAAQGAVVGPVRSPLGWNVVVVEAVTKVAGKTLDQAKPELVTEITQRKAAQALAGIAEKLEDGISSNATFDELVADNKLAAMRTPALLANGKDPENTVYQAPAPLMPILQAGFAAAPGDDPQVVPVGQNGEFALVALDHVVPAAPKPLAQIRDIVLHDYQLDQGQKAARQAAVKMVTAVNGGTPLAQAVSASGIRNVRILPVNHTRAQLAAAGKQLPPAITLIFSMTPHKAKLLASQDGSGYFVVYLDTVQQGDARQQPAIVANARQGLGGLIGNELAAQFTQAAGAEVKVSRNPAGIAKVKAELAAQAGTGAAD